MHKYIDHFLLRSILAYFRSKTPLLAKNPLLVKNTSDKKKTFLIKTAVGDKRFCDIQIGCFDLK